MIELPTGTVTFLFTDIEGSTKLLHELGDGYADALDAHRVVLRKAFADHGGAEVDTQGDAFFVAFTRASDAIAAAAGAQRGLAGGPIRVRMGIHTGEPLRTGEGYVGMDVHRAARIAAVGHGGQVLISQSARDLVEADLPADLALDNLGEHRLKDLSAPQQIFQLVGEGLEREFPPLATLETRSTNLPPQPTRLIGREQELAEVGELLRRVDVRLLTVTGPGGAGKTRLALQAAADLLDDFADGVFFVGLAGVTEPSLVIPAIAQTLGVKESGGLSAEEALERFVHERELLLVLDNLEHVLGAAPQIHQLVLNARALKAISSSRAPLRVSGEWEYPIPELADEDAVALFCERAEAIKPDFRLNGDATTVGEICRRLDGLPLAIELAAARAKVLSPIALLERLEQRLPILSVGARDLPDRQRTLRDTIAWSYELLDEDEQRLFARLALFVGGFTLAAAEQVCDADLDVLTSLVEKSLVRHHEERFRMLETVREFALERLEESGEVEQVARRHIEFFVGFVSDDESSFRRVTPEWLERVGSEQDNLRAAIQRARGLDDPRHELQLVALTGRFWELHGHLAEGLRRIVEALDRDPQAAAEIRAPALTCAAMMACKQGDYATARDITEQLGRLHEETHDERGSADVLNLLGVIALGDESHGEARDLLERAKSIRERVGDEVGLQQATHNLGLLALNQADYGHARPALEEALAIAEKHEWDPYIANSTCDLGFAELGEGRFDQARARFAAGLETALRLGWKENVAYCLVGLSSVDFARDRLDRAAHSLGQVDRIVEDTQLTFEIYAERERERVERVLRSHVGPDRLDALRAEGRSLSIEQAVAEALEP
jgi:predicted ATPase/class 3 adenylate cyclase